MVNLILMMVGDEVSLRCIDLMDSEINVIIQRFSVVWIGKHCPVIVFLGSEGRACW